MTQTVRKYLINKYYLILTVQLASWNKSSKLLVKMNTIS